MGSDNSLVVSNNSVSTRGRAESSTGWQVYLL